VHMGGILFRMLFVWEAFDWVLIDLEAFCSGDFCWEAFDRVLLTGCF
jgi:hypothetical protein